MGTFYYLDEGPGKVFILEQTGVERFDGKNIFFTCYPEENRYVPWGDFVGRISEKTLEGVFDQGWSEKGVLERHIKNDVLVTTKVQEEIEQTDDTIVMSSEEMDGISANSTENISSEQKSSNSWDSVLDEYERFVDKYISLLKKAQNGDISALTEYMSYLERAEALSEKLSNAGDDMTTAQMNRYMKILQKMTNAASNL